MTSFNAFACTVAPSHAYSSPVQLVDRNNSIYIARYYKFEIMKNRVVFYFEIINVLKGEKKTHIKLNFPADIYEEVDLENISITKKIDRDSKDFKENYLGRVNIAPNCKFYPVFENNKYYLLFPQKPYSSTSFEEVEGSNDSWAINIKNIIKKQQRIKGGRSKNKETNGVSVIGVREQLFLILEKYVL